MSAPTIRRREPAPRPERITRAQDRLRARVVETINMPSITEGEEAHRADQLSAIYRRIMLLWIVVWEASYRDGSGVDRLTGLAALDAAEHARSHLRFWREHAMYTRVIADGGTTKDADRAVRDASRAGWLA
jgi:hypothetical protein